MTTALWLLGVLGLLGAFDTMTALAAGTLVSARRDLYAVLGFPRPLAVAGRAVRTHHGRVPGRRARRGVGREMRYAAGQASRKAATGPTSVLTS